MTRQITGEAFKSMIINAAAAIEAHKKEINELNVFPVPDGDTGTNMSLTLGAGAKALAPMTPGTVGHAAESAASALLRGARGNSGVILSLLFRGMSRHLKDMDSAGAPAIAAALSGGVESAYKAVMKPTEGTILTVSRLAAARAVESSETEQDIETVLEHALETGYIALADTINQNPVLKKAGVIDAGAKGYLYILDGMLKALRGEMIEITACDDAPDKGVDFSGFSAEDIRFAYCTEFIIDYKYKRDVNRLRDFLDVRGDSIVVVDDEEIIKVHVHTNEPGAVLTEALTYGPLLTIKIENMREQHTESVIATGSPERVKPAAPEKEYGSVAVCVGSGIADVFRDLGADNIISGGQTMNPSTEEILEKINQTPSETVYVLPNNSNIIFAAQQCTHLTDKRVVVVPSKSIPQGIAAMLAMSSAGPGDDVETQMTEAISSVRTVLITHAARDSVFDGVDIREGEYLALLDDQLTATGPSVGAVMDEVARSVGQMTPEFITIFTGEDASGAESEGIADMLRNAAPGAEVFTVAGGQPVYSYMISVE